MLPSYKIYSTGDGALTLEFGNVIDEAVNEIVLKCFYLLKPHAGDQFVDIVPAYSSLTVFYDVIRHRNNGETAFANVSMEVEKILSGELAADSAAGRMIEIPVCYGQQLGPDLRLISEMRKLPIEEVIHVHSEKIYHVFMIGFLPGFPYMGEVDERIAVPRKQQPRRMVPAGSVGIAGMQTGIYSLDSPGGWQIIGRTPLQVFDPEADDPVLLRPGDKVKFYPITINEFENHKGGHF